MVNQKNPWLCIMIVGVFGMTLLIGLLGMLLLSYQDKHVGEGVLTIVGGAAGSLGTFLVTPPRGSHGMAQDGQQQSGK